MKFGKRYEYRLVRQDTQANIIVHKGVEAQINEMAKDGWRYVHTLKTEPHYPVLVFERKVRRA